MRYTATIVRPLNGWFLVTPDSARCPDMALQRPKQCSRLIAARKVKARTALSLPPTYRSQRLSAGLW